MLGLFDTTTAVNYAAATGVFCSVLQCVVVCCSVMRCVAVRCGVVQRGAAMMRDVFLIRLPPSIMPLHLVYVAVCCSVLQSSVVWCSVLQCAAVCAAVMT